MYKGSGNLAEDLKITHIMVGQTQASATALYNGESASTSGVDTSGYKDALFMLHVTQIDGASTMGASLYESDSNDSSTAVAITGADFGTFNERSAGIYSGQIRTETTKRYLWMRTQAAAIGTASYAASVVLSQAVSGPQTNARNKFEL